MEKGSWQQFPHNWRITDTTFMIEKWEFKILFLFSILFPKGVMFSIVYKKKKNI